MLDVKTNFPLYTDPADSQVLESQDSAQDSLVGAVFWVAMGCSVNPPRFNPARAKPPSAAATLGTRDFPRAAIRALAGPSSTPGCVQLPRCPATTWSADAHFAPPPGSAESQLRAGYEGAWWLTNAKIYQGLCRGTVLNLLPSARFTVNRDVRYLAAARGQSRRPRLPACGTRFAGCICLKLPCALTSISPSSWAGRPSAFITSAPMITSAAHAFAASSRRRAGT
jgi:hypothetical protein